MRLILARIFMCFVLLLQMHCTSIAKRSWDWSGMYQSPRGEDVRKLCDLMFTDSGIKNVKLVEEKLAYQKCLQDNFANPEQRRRGLMAGTLFPAMLLGLLYVFYFTEISK